MHSVCTLYASPTAYIYSPSALRTRLLAFLYALYAVNSEVVCLHSVHSRFFDAYNAYRARVLSSIVAVEGETCAIFEMRDVNSSIVGWRLQCSRMKLAVFYPSSSERARCSRMLHDAGWTDLRLEGFAPNTVSGPGRPFRRSCRSLADRLSRN